MHFDPKLVFLVLIGIFFAFRVVQRAVKIHRSMRQRRYTRPNPQQRFRASGTIWM